MRFKGSRGTNYIDYDRNVGYEYFENTIIAPLDRLVNNTITDPGASGVIPVTESGICEIVTGGAETRTLAVPTFAGQAIVINMITDGGDCVITVADPHIDGTNNTITMNDAGDTIVLVARKTAATPTYGWALVCNVGCTLSHV
jgi:hypothetical protein